MSGGAKMTETKPNPEPPRAAPPVEGRMIAVIDVGASAIRMDVAVAQPDGQVQVLESLKKACNLGRDTFAGGRIETDTVEECVAILKGFRGKLDEYGLLRDDQIRAVATSAMREAENRDPVLDRIYVATGIAVESIEEPEVHRLTFLALQQALRDDKYLKQGDVLVVEAGAGGTTVLFIRDGRVTNSETLRAGSLRLRETFDALDSTGARGREAIEQQITRAVEQIRQFAPVRSLPCLIAVVGDFPKDVLGLLPDVGKRAATNVVAIGYRKFARAERLAAMPVNDLVRRCQVAYADAEKVGPALYSYLCMARAFRVKEVVLVNTDLRHGLLLNEAGRGAWTERVADQVIHSALALGEKYAFDCPHAMHVADLAVRLFRELQPEHRLEQRYEVLLRTAGLLHDIGAFVSMRSHHKHSMYLIGNSELFGLTSRETLIIALVARYHRRAMPLPMHEGYATLDRQSRIIVTKLAAILRVADALDRAHTQRVRNVSFAREKGRFVIVAADTDDVTIEQVALEQKGAMFATVYGMEAVLRPAAPMKGAGGRD